MRQEAQWKYDNGTQEYRDEIDKIGCGVWAVVIAFAAVIGLLIYAIGGQDALIKWLR